LPSLCFLLGVLGDKFAPVGKALSWFGMAFMLPIYGLVWVLDNSVPEDEDALAAWAIVLIGVGIYSWKLLVNYGALLCAYFCRLKANQMVGKRAWLKV
jgi:hypothetical protein